MIKFLYAENLLDEQNVERAENLKRKKELQIGLNEVDTVTLNVGASLTLDFGKEIRGGIRILTYSLRAQKCAKVRIRFGESLSECNAELGYKNAGNDHSPRDMEVQLSAWSDLTFGETGFRFVKIDLLTDFAVNIKTIVAKSYELNKKAKYTYCGNDKELKAIFDTAKRTIDLCSVGGYVYDGIKRDRLVWVGDMYPEMLSLTTLYGRFSPLEKSLLFAKKQYPLPQMMYNMPTYSFWWILIVCDYCKITGEEEFLVKQLDYIHGLLNVFSNAVSQEGRLNLSSYFVDWPSVDTEDEYVGAVCIAIAAYKRGVEELKKFGYSTDLFEKTLQNLYKNDFTVKKQKQVVALKYFAFGEISDKEYAMLISGGAKGFSTFMSYFIGKAIAARDKALAIKLMKEYYGGMLKIGATTFFEDFDIEWLNDATPLDELPKEGKKDVHGDYGAYCYKGFRHSLCHGWASGIIPFIKEFVQE